MNIQKALAEFITFSAQREDAISVIVSTPAYGQAPLYALKTGVLVGVAYSHASRSPNTI